MQPDQNSLQSKLEVIRVKFITLLDDRLDKLETLRDQIDIEGSRQKAFQDIQFIAHKISGTAGTLGYTEIGQLASKTEETIIQYLLAKGRGPTFEDTKQVIDLFIENTAERCSIAYWQSVKRP